MYVSSIVRSQFPFPATACAKKGQKMTGRVPKQELISITFLMKKIIQNLVSSLKSFVIENQRKLNESHDLTCDLSSTGRTQTVDT